MTGTSFSIEIQAYLPERLRRLADLANDLQYSWDRRIRGLFVRLDPELWEACGHNPKVFLRRVSQQRLDEAVTDRVFLEDYSRALSAYDTYHNERHSSDIEPHLDPASDLVAYFCAEFGLHESLPIYSGGLGILAGDHCKAASDLGVPFVAVGLLYRQGYFNQTIDSHGKQIAHCTPTDFADLPITPALNAQKREVHIVLDIAGRHVEVKVWKAKAGHITLYLLDSDLPCNGPEDRSITYQLYGGDIHTRIQQEILLGLGGVRALRALGLKPTVWHINEGHAAFQILERCRELVEQGLQFDAALEVVASGTVFTTHTPVPAGHDIFDHKLMDTYFYAYHQQLGIGHERFLALGASPANSGGFNQTALALRGSRFHNGVSRIHGSVASSMEGYIWPQVSARENPIRYVTNGVHVPTFLAREWLSLFDMRFGGEWRNELLNPDYWSRIGEIPGHQFWSLRQSLKAALLEDVCRRALRQHRRNGASEAQIKRVTRYLNAGNTDILTFGFARRFATYKRAALLFADPERLGRIVNNPDQPMLFIFAGKAHPHDLPGQRLIQIIHEFSRQPEFEGKIILLEGYDLALARRLVSGVDVWVNTPEYPLEASGTSGQKAGINGVLNLSVLDGWWGEGYNGQNGWAITPHGPEYESGYRTREESQELLDLIEREIGAAYYERNGKGHPETWVRMSKASMESLIPRFNAQRMVMDYVRDHYGAASRQHRLLRDNEYSAARELAAWKKNVSEVWPRVRFWRVDSPVQYIRAGEVLPVRVVADLQGLHPNEVVVECLLGHDDEHGEFQIIERHALAPIGGENGETEFQLELRPRLSGLKYYKVRMYPHHWALSHPFETGHMLWL